MHEGEEGALLQSARDGDAAAFESLVAPLVNLLHSGVSRILANPQDSKDALQEALLHIYRSLATFQGRCRFSTWAYRIAVNEALMLRRSRLRNREVPLEWVDNYPNEAHTRQVTRPEAAQPASAHVAAEGAQLRERILEAMAWLPEEQRIVFNLRALEGWDTPEVARYLGLTPVMVRQRFHRANVKMRHMLDAALTGGRP